MTITLNEQEVRLAKFIAKRRTEVNRANGIKDSKRGGQDSEFIETEGIAGEIAFCKLFNLYPDLSVDTVTQSTDVGDCVYKGYKVDVKTTSYKSGRLLSVHWKNDDIEVYALMIGTIPTYEFKGFAYASELKSDKHLTDLGRGDVYCMEQNQLIMDI